MSEKWAFPIDNLRLSIFEYYLEKPAIKACDQGETWTQEAKRCRQEAKLVMHYFEIGSM